MFKRKQKALGSEKQQVALWYCKYQIFIESIITETLGWLFKKEKEWGEKLILCFHLGT